MHGSSFNKILSKNFNKKFFRKIFTKKSFDARASKRSYRNRFRRISPTINNEIELSNPSDLTLEFSDPKPISIANLTKINIRQREKPVIIGVRKDWKYKTESMALVLDETTVKAFESVLSQCESHLGKPVSKFLYRRDDGSVTAYVKLKTSKNEILSKFYENGEEIDPLKYEGKSCDAKATLAIEGLVLGNNVNLQVKVHDANVRPKTYEHVRLVDLVRNGKR